MENLQDYKTNILYFLTINNLDESISYQQVKKIIKKKKLWRFIPDKFDNSLDYVVGITYENI